MTKLPNSKRYDLEERALKFCKRVVSYINGLPKGLTNIEVCKQLMRSAGSIGANYIEANESLSRKDFLMRVKIARKEAKETLYWLELSESNKESYEKEFLIREATELKKILSAIILKTE